MASALALLYAAAGCGDDGETSAVVDGKLEVVEIRVEPRVAPGTPVKVAATIRNAGDAAWPRGLVLEYQGDPEWQADAWTTPEPVPVGGMITIEQIIPAPTQIGLHTLLWRALGEDGPFGADLVAHTEVTCSDGVFCNGDERYVGGACVPGAPPCEDGASCTVELCDEALGLCSHMLAEDDCPSCAREACTPDCTGRVCGDDGCGGSCGACTDGLACVDGECSTTSQPGTCSNPLPLVADGVPLVGTHVVTADTTMGLHIETPVCNTASTARELVYVFTTAETVGIDARMAGHDTVLDLRLAECADLGASIACSDDSTPPGDTGSRVVGRLQPGTYYLIADGYSALQAGPFTLTVRITGDGCVPQCDGRFCGDDGCGGACGACAVGEVCLEGGRCRQDPCIPQCDGRACGDDECGGSCGACAEGELCVPADGQCRVFAQCDHGKPVCEDGCSAGEYCGTDCQCQRVNEPTVDLVVGSERLRNEVIFETRTFDEASCAVFEGCVGGMGDRRLLRFTVSSVNQGQGQFVPPQPAERPDLFEFSPCHEHYHFKGFAQYALLDRNGVVVVPGRKQAYCLVDSEQVSMGPNVACEPAHDCSDQGLQAGWADIYANDLDCQWLDITGVPPGEYQLQVTLNPERIFDEESFANNTTAVPVVIPPVDSVLSHVEVPRSASFPGASECRAPVGTAR